jgi:hypothetical protein
MKELIKMAIVVLVALVVYDLVIKKMVIKSSFEDEGYEVID